MSSIHVLRWVGAEGFVAAPLRPSPALLRFDGDDFMDRMLSTLADTPQDLPKLVAKPETWQALAAPTPSKEPAAPRSRQASALARSRSLLGFRRGDQVTQSPPPAVPVPAVPLKLFQPVHQRYYIAAAHLVCELPGLPTRTTAAGDRSGMLLRRLVIDDKTGAAIECAFVKKPGASGRWVATATPDQPVLAEEWLSVFPMAYTAPAGPARRLLGGLIPVARHDEYRFAALADTSDAAEAQAWSRADDLKALARMKIIAPWQGLIERARLARDATQESPGKKPWDSDAATLAASNETALKLANNQLQEASWRLLQEFSEWLGDVLPDVHRCLASGTPAGAAARQLLLTLDQAQWNATLAAPLQPYLSTEAKTLSFGAANLRQALAAIAGASAALDKTETAFPQGEGWPLFAFPLAAASLSADLGAASAAWPPLPGPSGDAQEMANLRLETLVAALDAAIMEALAAGRVGEAVAQASSAARLAAELKLALERDAGPPRYVLRFAHQRCDCGPLHPALLSAPSEPFELAGFFDPDAPLRPIRIALPFDTSPGGLRRYGKNSAFIMSDLLCGQMKRVRKLGFGDLVLSVLPWPFHKDLSTGDMGPCGGSAPADRFGTICSLSIPIITIVAFILLIVIATLLDLIFRWLPFLMVCFPVPKLKGKK